MNIPWSDLPTFDWRTVISAALGAVTAWFAALLARKAKK